MRYLIIMCLSACCQLQAQQVLPKQAKFNVRLSFLVVPAFSPLFTVEARATQKLTLQAETNFINTHGINIKYFLATAMQGHYIFIGNAFLRSKNLRSDNGLSYLPYAGYGYAHWFGATKAWVWDSRIGIGPTLNANNNLVLPVIKTGIGRTF
jgi:hypothetical protein